VIRRGPSAGERLEVWPLDAMCRNRWIGHRDMDYACEKIVDFINKILNIPAREALK